MREASPAGRAGGRHARERRPSGEERADRNALHQGWEATLNWINPKAASWPAIAAGTAKESAISANNNADGMSAKAMPEH